MKKKQMGRKAKAERKSALQKQKIAMEKGFGAWKDEDPPELATPEDSSAFVRAIRDAGER
ncbi:MAG: hypothetical protein HYX80_00140 [Chloroflexi bacterium]|nr:hypothetical protein [Chloroflexota bacterium]